MTIDMSPNETTINTGSQFIVSSNEAQFGSYAFRSGTDAGGLRIYNNSGDNYPMSFGSSPWTIESWLYWANNFGGDSYANDYFMDFRSNLNLGYMINGDGFNFPPSSSGLINTGQWYHIAYAYDGSNLRFFLNGTEIDSGGEGTYPLANEFSNSDQFFYFFTYYGGGVNDNDYGLEGYIDQLRITKGVARYTSNFTPPSNRFCQ